MMLLLCPYSNEINEFAFSAHDNTFLKFVQNKYFLFGKEIMIMKNEEKMMKEEDNYAPGTPQDFSAPPAGQI